MDQANGHVSTEVIDEGGRRRLRVDLAGEIFYLPFKLIAGREVGFLDISGQFRLIERAADLLVERLRARDVAFDTVLNPVSKSNALAHAIAVRWAAAHPGLERTVVARKSDDPRNPARAVYRSVTTTHDQTLSITPDDAAFLDGKRILLVDDVFGGGGTTRALRSLADQTHAVVVAHAVVAVEQGADVPPDLTYLFELPVL